MQLSDEEIFSVAIELNGSEAQDGYVLSTCNDTTQQERILKLLRSHRVLETKTTFLLDRSAEAHAELCDADELEQDNQVGPYRVLQLLGEGGMGLVYQAEQSEPIRRRVALKVLKPGMDSRKVLARFELERQALAGMDHPSITKILDAGITDSGRPYFAMELVKGSTITEYCKSNSLAPMDCIRLMILVCSAIQHAHQRGIIHRDIKPSNILVSQTDGKPLPKVIDFGIAKAVNDAMNVNGHFTFQGELIGTPAYMSPEQAISSLEGVDVRTDVYSLGVLLYELLTGSTPGEVTNEKRNGLTSVRSLLSDSNVEPPSTRMERTSKNAGKSKALADYDVAKMVRFLRGEVDCIILKALARDRQLRYQSVVELQRDLERFVEGSPIEAAPASLLYHLRKLISRHRAIASVGAFAIALVLIASCTAIWFGIQATTAKHDADERLKEVLTMQSELMAERDRAVDAEKKSRLLAQTYLLPAILDKAIERFCAEQFEQMKAVNSKLNDVKGPVEKLFNSVEVLETIFASNIVAPNDRLVVLDDSKWLLKILSDISKKDIGALLPLSGAIDTTDSGVQAVPVQIVPTPVQSSDRFWAVDGAANVEVGATGFVGSDSWPKRKFNFSPTVRLAYYSILCDELQKIDRDLPIVADSEDNLGLCSLELGELEKAMSHFQESLRIRKSYSAQQLLTIQTRLFIAECLCRTGKRDSSQTMIQEARKELDEYQDADSSEVDKLRKLANEIAEICEAASAAR